VNIGGLLFWATRYMRVGVYHFQIKGSVADVDGQLVPGDQILVVNGVDVRSSQQQETAAMLKVDEYSLFQVQCELQLI